MESSLVFKPGPGPKVFEFQNIVKIKTKSLNLKNQAQTCTQRTSQNFLSVNQDWRFIKKGTMK
jgi:hypothetical protein